MQGRRRELLFAPGGHPVEAQRGEQPEHEESRRRVCGVARGAWRVASLKAIFASLATSAFCFASAGVAAPALSTTAFTTWLRARLRQVAIGQARVEGRADAGEEDGEEDGDAERRRPLG